MTVYDDINSALELNLIDPDQPTGYGCEVLEFIARHFDLRPLTPAARLAVRYAGSKNERVFRFDDPVDSAIKENSDDNS
jgi:hypothetical protein